MFYISLGIVFGICFLETIITGFRCVLTYEKKFIFILDLFAFIYCFDAESNNL